MKYIYIHIYLFNSKSFIIFDFQDRIYPSQNIAQIAFSIFAILRARLHPEGISTITLVDPILFHW